ncbi:hypothetical protein ACFL0W_01545 [Nanoarchaeota archaeon]
MAYQISGSEELIDETDKYVFTIFEPKEQVAEEVSLDRHQTYFVHSGKLEIEFISGDSKEKLALEEGSGITITAGTNYKRQIKEGSIIFFIAGIETSPGTSIKIILEDEQGNKTEKNISKYDLTQPKNIKKPWGSESWIIWSKEFYVMKIIKMNEGNKSSLQLHRNKLETNYLLEGKANVVDGFKVDLNLSEEEMQSSINGVDFNQYKELKTQGMHWTSKPGTVHRVIAETNYLAYEVSTPELDDVTRLEDDSQRNSGRIEEEHREK